MAQKMGEAVQGPTSPLSMILGVTPANDTPLAFNSRAVYVGVTGNLHVRDMKGVDTVLVGLAAGVWHPMQVQIIHSTGTTATDVAIGA
jgi:hypothetical protein